MDPLMDGRDLAAHLDSLLTQPTLHKQLLALQPSVLQHLQQMGTERGRVHAPQGAILW